MNPYHGEEVQRCITARPRMGAWGGVAPLGGFSVKCHGPPPDGGASRRWEDFRLSVTARPRKGGRRAVGRCLSLSVCLVAGCGRLNPYNGEDLPSRFTARPRVGGVAP